MFKMIYGTICLVAAAVISIWTFYKAFFELDDLAIGIVFVTIMQIINIKMDNRFSIEISDIEEDEE